MRRLASRIGLWGDEVLNYRPIAETVAAALGSWVLILVLHADALDAGLVTLRSLGWFVLGLVFTQLVEFWYHRVVMHRGVRFLRGIKRNHLRHHRLFRGESFRVRNPQNLEHVSGLWYVFPSAYLTFCAALTLVLPSLPLVAFLTGAVGHYVLFEITHWFAHIEDNFFDRWLSHIPILSRIRSYQILHHRIHHQTPNVAFNFNPPYLGDVLLRLMPRTPQDSRPGPLSTLLFVAE